MMNCEENNSSPGDPNPILIPEINNKKNRSAGRHFEFSLQILYSGLETGLAGPELDHVVEHRLVPRPPGVMLRVLSRGYGHTEAGGPEQSFKLDSARIRTRAAAKETLYAFICTHLKIDNIPP